MDPRCEKCKAACCRGLGFVPWSRDEREHLEEVLPAEARKREENIDDPAGGDCPHLSPEAMCLLAQDYGRYMMPAICRQVQPGDKICTEARASLGKEVIDGG